MGISVSGCTLLVFVMDSASKAVLDAGSAADAVISEFRFSCLHTDISHRAHFYAGSATCTGASDRELISNSHSRFKLVVFHVIFCQKLLEG